MEVYAYLEIKSPGMEEKFMDELEELCKKYARKYYITCK